MLLQVIHLEYPILAATSAHITYAEGLWISHFSEANVKKD